MKNSIEEPLLSHSSLLDSMISEMKERFSEQQQRAIRGALLVIPSVEEGLVRQSDKAIWKAAIVQFATLHQDFLPPFAAGCRAGHECDLWYQKWRRPEVLRPV